MKVGVMLMGMVEMRAVHGLEMIGGSGSGGSGGDERSGGTADGIGGRDGCGDGQSGCRGNGGDGSDDVERRCGVREEIEVGEGQAIVAPKLELVTMAVH